jgi:glycerol-3-phosphate acyltransferase PlsY
MIDIFSVLIYSYLLGSVPFGLIYTKIAGLGDVRNIGSGNIGATNVLRTGNKQIAAYTLLSDIGKGSIAVPVWLKFKGGKGVATFIGGILPINYILFFVFIVSWGVIAKVFKISSLSALIAFAITLITSFFLFERNITLLIFFFTVFSVYTHRDNIKRMLSGEETKIKTK